MAKVLSLPGRAAQLIKIYSKVEYGLLNFFKSKGDKIMIKEKCVCQNTIYFKHCAAAELSWPTHQILHLCLVCMPAKITA